MTRAARRSFDTFCRDAVDLLDRAGAPYLIIGGLAVAVIGEPRMTGDIDVVAFVTLERAEQFIGVAITAGFEVAADERQRLHETGTLRFHKGGFQFDIILASLPFEDAARARARTGRLFGRSVPLPTPEDLILFKVLAGRDKDLVDAVGIARRHLASLDRAYLTATLDDICDLAEDVEPRRRLDAVLDKARG
ncbi:MAG: hypothetical protein ABL886_12940 [Rhodoglobus sp.]